MCRFHCVDSYWMLVDAIWMGWSELSRTMRVRAIANGVGLILGMLLAILDCKWSWIALGVFVYQLMLWLLGVICNL